MCGNGSYISFTVYSLSVQHHREHHSFISTVLCTALDPEEKLSGDQAPVTLNAITTCSWIGGDEALIKHQVRELILCRPAMMIWKEPTQTTQEDGKNWELTFQSVCLL